MLLPITGCAGAMGAVSISVKEENSAGASVGRNYLLDGWAVGFGVGGFAATSCSWVLTLQISHFRSNVLSGPAQAIYMVTLS